MYIRIALNSKSSSIWPIPNHFSPFRLKIFHFFDWYWLPGLLCWDVCAMGEIYILFVFCVQSLFNAIFGQSQTRIRAGIINGHFCIGLTHTLSLSHTHTHKHTLSLFQTLTLTHAHEHSISLFHTHLHHTRKRAYRFRLKSA